MRSDRHRRGYAAAATTAISEATFAALAGIGRIEIQMDHTNLASAGAAARAGYRNDRPVALDKVASGHTGQGWIWIIDRNASPTSRASFPCGSSAGENSA